MNIPTPQELCQRKEANRARSDESTSTFDTVVDTILEALEFYQKGTFEIVWLVDFTNDNEISKAISRFETQGWTVLKQSSTVPDWIILFANNEETVENCDITGEDTEEIAEFFQNNGWTVDIRQPDPGHLICHKSVSE